MDEPCDVEMIIEGRMGFGQHNVNQFLAEFHKEYALLADNLPSIINIFSKISITIADKTHPGLQVVDFMLWAMNRVMMIPCNNTWRDRLTLKLMEFLSTEDADQNSGHYYLEIRSTIIIQNCSNILHVTSQTLAFAWHDFMQ